MQNISSANLTLRSYTTPSSACWKGYLRPSNTSWEYSTAATAQFFVQVLCIMYILCTYTAVQWRKRSPKPKAQHISGMHSHPSFLHSTTAQAIICFTISLPFQRTNSLLWLVSNHHCAANISDQLRTPSSPWGYFHFIICLVSCSGLICFPNNCPFILKLLQHLQSNTSFGWTQTDPFCLDLQPPLVSAWNFRSSLICTGDHLPSMQEIQTQNCLQPNLSSLQLMMWESQSWLTEHIPSRRHLNLEQDREEKNPLISWMCISVRVQLMQAYLLKIHLEVILPVDIAHVHLLSASHRWRQKSPNSQRCFCDF